MRRSFLAFLFCFLTASGSAHAANVYIGTVTDWVATPKQKLDDKDWVYLENNGNWNGDELLVLNVNPSQTSHSLGIYGLGAYSGPITLEVGYRIDVTSEWWMSSMALDHDHTGDDVTTYKDLYLTEKDFLTHSGAGDGTFASLSITNGGAAVDVALPMWTRHLWVRDTIVVGTKGSLLGMSNTVTQVVPEPGSLALFGTGTACALIAVSRRRKGARG